MGNSFFEYPEKVFEEEKVDGFRKSDCISIDTSLFISVCQVFKCILEKLTFDKELRIIVNYDPQKKKVKIRYFTSEKKQD